MTKQIPLTHRQIALVDDWRYDELSQWKWHAVWNEHTQSFYAARTEGRAGSRKRVRMHRQIANTPEGMLCDHINHNTLDNQEHNLRNVTNSQNNMNSHVHFDNRLGEKGITRNRHGYQVSIWKNRKRVFSKYFSTLEEAIIARDAAVRKFHGEYAYRGEA